MKKKHQCPSIDLLTILPGDLIFVRRDDGTISPSIAESTPWKLYSGRWLIHCQGIRGGYDLSRVSRRKGGEQ